MSMPMAAAGCTVDVQVVDQLIETGDSEAIFQRAIQEQGRGQVRKEAHLGLPVPEMLGIPSQEG